MWDLLIVSERESMELYDDEEPIFNIYDDADPISDVYGDEKSIYEMNISTDNLVVLDFEYFAENIQITNYAMTRPI